MKPIASGSQQTPQGMRNPDALALHSAMNVRATYDEVNPYAFGPAIAPHIAASEAGRPIDMEVLDRCYERLARQCDVIVVEGVGGWLVPLDEARSFADLASRWQLDVVLVVGLRLGCLNHAFLTQESIERRGLRLRGWVANAMDPTFERREENLATLRGKIAAPCLGTLPYSPHSTGADAASILARGILGLAPLERG